MTTDAEGTSAAKMEIGHVLALDVVGYSTRLIDDQTRVMAELNSVVRESTCFRVAQASDALISLPTGDGMILVFFGDPEAAIECALEISSALKKHTTFRVRMGIHSGPVNRVADVNESQNVAGAGIDLAQRVMDCGDAGHILLSRRVAYDLAPLPRWGEHLYELGDFEIKHNQKISLVNFHTAEAGNPETPAKVERAHAEAAARQQRSRRNRQVAMAIALLVVLVVAASVGLFVHRRFATIGPPVAAVSPPEKSIAVLPFADMSPAHDQEYLCDGMSEELLDSLAKTEGLRVVARTSSFSFKDGNLEANEIGRLLNVSNLVEGTLRREGDRIRVSARLINARDGYQLWSDSYDMEMVSVFALEDEITRKIVEALKVKLAVNPSPRPLENLEAYELYSQGLFFSNKSDEKSLRKSVDLFHQALERDPTLSRAWTGIAKDWNWLADAYVRPLEGHPLCRVAAGKALGLNERDAEAHAYLGEEKRILDYDLKGEEAELNRALEIDPNSAVAHSFMAVCLTVEGNRANGLRQIQEAIRLDPRSPIIGSLAVTIYLGSDHLDEALAEAKRTMEIDPDYVYFEPNLALVYREQGRLQEALEIYQRLEQTRHQPSSSLVITYARLGRTDDARKALARLISAAETGYVPGELIAAAYLSLGDKDSAIHWLNRAVEEHSGGIHVIGFEREFRPLRTDPRFLEILRRIGLDPDRLLGRP